MARRLATIWEEEEPPTKAAKEEHAHIEAADLVKVIKVLLRDAAKLEDLVDKATVHGENEEERKRAGIEATVAIEMWRELGVSLDYVAADIASFAGGGRPKDVTETRETKAQKEICASLLKECVGKWNDAYHMLARVR